MKFYWLSRVEIYFHIIKLSSVTCFGIEFLNIFNKSNLRNVGTNRIFVRNEIIPINIKRFYDTRTRTKSYRYGVKKICFFTNHREDKLILRADFSALCIHRNKRNNIRVRGKLEIYQRPKWHVETFEFFECVLSSRVNCALLSQG